MLQALFLITNKARHQRATGLLTASGVILSDAHIATDSRLQDLEVTSSKGEPVPLRGMDLDRGLDVAFLLPARAAKGGLELGDGGDFGPGDQVYAWGFSDGFDPPQPLLCIGFVAGFHLAAGEPEREGATRLVIGGPFSEGFAGAPVFRWRDNQMVGLLVMRPAARGAIVEAVPVQALRERLDRVD